MDTIEIAFLVAVISIWFAVIIGLAFFYGVRYGTKQQGKVKTEFKIVEVEKPFVVTKETIREVSAPGFIYPQRGTPDRRQDLEDKKMQELITEPEL